MAKEELPEGDVLGGIVVVGSFTLICFGLASGGGGERVVLHRFGGVVKGGSGNADSLLRFGVLNSLWLQS